MGISATSRCVREDVSICFAENWLISFSTTYNLRNAKIAASTQRWYQQMEILLCLVSSRELWAAMGSGIGTRLGWQLASPAACTTGHLTHIGFSEPACASRGQSSGFNSHRDSLLMRHSSHSCNPAITWETRHWIWSLLKFNLFWKGALPSATALFHCFPFAFPGLYKDVPKEHGIKLSVSKPCHLKPMSFSHLPQCQYCSLKKSQPAQRKRIHLAGSHPGLWGKH